MNEQLAAAAVAGVTNSATESKPGFCSRWVRQVVEGLYPGTYNALFAGSANETGQNFRQAGFGVAAASAGPVEVGDILVKEFAPFGHIGIAVSNGSGGIKVAENSSTKIGRVAGAKGYRELAIWGAPSVVVRLPGEASANPVGYELLLNGNSLCAMPLVNGVSLAPVRLLCQRLGLDVDLDETTGNVIIGGQDYGSKPTIIGSTGYLPVRPLARFFGLAVTVDEEAQTVNLTRT